MVRLETTRTAADSRVLSLEPRFAAFKSAFERAAAAAGGVFEFRFTIAGFAVSLRFAGDAMITPITRAFSHLPPHVAASADLTVCIWDSASTGLELPAEVGSMNDHVQHSAPWSVASGRFRSAYQLPRSGLSMLDLDGGEAVFAVANAHAVPFWDATAPLRAILNWWLASKDLQLIHAAAVGFRAGGLLLVGKGGSGKSTTALASLAGGLAYAGDDYCAVSTTPAPFVHSLYSSGKVAPDGLHRIAKLQPFVSNPDRLDDEKAVFWLHEVYPERVAVGLPIVAVVFPAATGSDAPSIKPLSRVAALAALAPSTLMQLPGGATGGLARMAALVAGLPCYSLELSDDPAPAVSMLRDLLLSMDLTELLQ